MHIIISTEGERGERKGGRERERERERDREGERERERGGGGRERSLYSQSCPPLISSEVVRIQFNSLCTVSNSLL